MNGDLRLSPPWKHALRTLLDAGMVDGQIIKKQQLVALFGLSKPRTAEDQERFQLDFMRQFGELRAELLETHRLMLRTMHGERSYEVVSAMEQTDLAIREGARDMTRAVRNMGRGLTFIRQEQLTDDERRKNADALAKTAMLAGMVSKKRLT